MNTTVQTEPTPRALAETIYENLTDEEDARACLDIPEQACRETPASFLLILIGNFLTKVGDQIANAKTVLPWLMSTVGAPVALTSLLVPLRESGSLLPQLAIAGYVRTLPLRKWVWFAGSIAQAAAIAAIGIAAATLHGRTAGWAIVGALALFSLARGFCSVASKDVLGKTVPKKKRGQLNGWSASSAGLVTVAVGGALMIVGPGEGGDLPYGAMLAGGAALWVAAALVFAAIREFPGETSGGDSALRHALSSLALLREDAAFRRYLLVRALFISSALSAPYYVLLAQAHSSRGALLLGLFVAVSGLSSLLSGPFWGRLADYSSRRVMLIAATIASLTSLAVWAAAWLMPVLLGELWFLPLAYFVLNIGHNGIRVGRKTYVVDLAGGNRRTDYVAISNTMIGIILLAAGGLAAVVSTLGIAPLILLFALTGLTGIALGGRMKETQ